MSPNVLNIKELISTFLPHAQWIKQTQGYKVNPCPYCGHNDCFDVTTDYSQYQCFSCKSTGNYHTLAKHLGTTAFQQSKNPPHHSIQSKIIYTYTDEFNTPIYRIIRTIPKGFFQEHFNGKEWKQGLGNSPPLLYKLPNIIAAIKENKPIFIFEGEKDAENAIKYFNITATTNSGGSISNSKQDSKKWSDEMTEYLRNADIYIIPDNDEPGQIHADFLCHKLYRIAKLIKVINLPNLPPKGDFTDWLSQGNTFEKFAQIIENTKPFATYESFSWHEIMQMNLPTKHWIIPGILKEGNAILLVGKPKLGKSWLALEWSIAKATGGYSLGKHKVEPGTVLYLAYEDSNYTIQERARMLKCDDEPIHNLHIMYHSDRLEPDKGIKEVNDFLQDHPDTKLIIFDTYAYCKPKRSRNDDIVDFDSSIGRTLVRIANKFNLGIILIHHSGKMTREDVHDETIGTTGLRGSFSGSIQLKQIRETPEQKDFILHIEGREIRGGKWQVKYDRIHHWLQLISEQADIPQQTEGRTEIINILKKSKNPMTSKTIAEEIGKSQDNVRKVLDRLDELGIIAKVGKKGKANLYQLAIEDYNEEQQTKQVVLQPIIGKSHIKND